MSIGFGVAILIACVLVAALLTPYLFEEIWRGKKDANPRIPTGAADIHPGRRGNPAPGQTDAQSDPWDSRASR